MSAYMELVLCNTQSELHPLEEGKHAAESGMDLKAYVKASNPGLNDDQLKAKYRTLYDKVLAWKVWSVLHVQNEATRDAWRNLTAIASAPAWLHNALHKQMIESGWTVQVTRDKVASFKDCPTVPEWADSEKVATHDPPQLPLKL